MAANGCKWLHMAANCCKWLQMAANGSKCIQMYPNGPKLLQRVGIIGHLWGQSRWCPCLKHPFLCILLQRDRRTIIIPLSPAYLWSVSLHWGRLAIYMWSKTKMTSPGLYPECLADTSPLTKL